MKVPPVDYVRVLSVEEAVDALGSDEDAKVLAGGQSLIPLLALRLARPSVLVDLGGLALAEVAVGEGRVRTGSLLRQRSLESDPLLVAGVPLLAEAAAHVGYPATRNRGTLGGSLAHADPAAELPAVAVALGATLEVAGRSGRREVPAGEFFRGYFTTALAGEEVLTAVSWPAAAPGHGAAWCEWAPRAHDFAHAGVGVAVELDEAGTLVGLGAAACAVGDRPTDLAGVLGPLCLGAGAELPDRLVESVAAAVTAAVADRVPGDVAALTGLLGGRALCRAVRRAGATRREPSGLARRAAGSPARPEVRETRGACHGGVAVRRQAGERQAGERGGTAAAAVGISLVVNGQRVELDLPARETLLDTLRERAGSTGTHAGCEQGSCGACSVLLDGAVVRSCLVLTASVPGAEVTTIEAVGRPGRLHPVQEALARHHGLQCGFCTPGVVLAALDLLAVDPSPTPEQVRDALAGNLCRCTGYSGMVAAIAGLAGPHGVSGLSGVGAPGHLPSPEEGP